MKNVTIGVVGAGSIAQYHLKAYAANSEVKIAAICDINESVLNKTADAFGIQRRYISLADMLENETLDAISVCTWNSEHAPCTIAALNAGVHVLCEKPMALNAAQAVAMEAAARQNNRLLMVGFVRRFGNDAALLNDCVQSDEFGELYYAKATYLRRNGNPGGWFSDKSRSGGGALIDLGVHVIDLVRYLCGSPKAVSVYGASFQKLFNRAHLKEVKGYLPAGESDASLCDVEDMATALIRFDSGLVLAVETSFSLNIKKDEGEIQLFGTKGGAKIDPELELFSECNGRLANVSFASPTALSFDGLFESEINHFIECVQGKTECRACAADGVEIMRILDAIYESAKSGHEVILQ